MKIKFYRIFKCKIGKDQLFHSEDAQPTSVAFTSKAEADKYCLVEGNKKIGIVYTVKEDELEIFKTCEETQEPELTK